MARSIDPIKKHRYKQSRLKGESITQSLKDAGYSDSTAESFNSRLTSVKLCEDEIALNFKLAELTPQKVLSEIEALQARATTDNEKAIVTRLLELKGRYLAMFTDKQQIETKDVTDLGKAFMDELGKAHPKRKRFTPTTDEGADKAQEGASSPDEARPSDGDHNTATGSDGGKGSTLGKPDDKEDSDGEGE